MLMVKYCITYAHTLTYIRTSACVGRMGEKFSIHVEKNIFFLLSKLKMGLATRVSLEKPKTKQNKNPISIA